MADVEQKNSSRHGDRFEKTSHQSDKPLNVFANDGSFMEMFKRRMETTQPAQSNNYSKNISKETEARETEIPKKTLLPFVGKRRGNAPVLKTGAVKKKKKDEDEVTKSKKDPWAQYMAEVKRYKDMSCQDEDKTRPLVK